MLTLSTRRMIKQDAIAMRSFTRKKSSRLQIRRRFDQIFVHAQCARKKEDIIKDLDVDAST